MVDTIARKDHERSLRPTATIDQSLCDTVRLAAGGSEGQALPSTGVIALGEKIAIWIKLRLLPQQVDDGRSVGSKRHGREELERTASEMPAPNQGWRQIDRFEGRLASLDHTDAALATA
jgi:hypothetical protein